MKALFLYVFPQTGSTFRFLSNSSYNSERWKRCFLLMSHPFGLDEIFSFRRVSTRICGRCSASSQKARFEQHMLSFLKPEALAVHAHLPRVFKLSAPMVLGCVVRRLKHGSSPLTRLVTHLQVVLN